jgi:hypothetical protein
MLTLTQKVRSVSIGKPDLSTARFFLLTTTPLAFVPCPADTPRVVDAGRHPAIWINRMTRRDRPALPRGG